MDGDNVWIVWIGKGLDSMDGDKVWIVWMEIRFG